MKKIELNFKDWLVKEVGTSTAAVAGFSRIALPMVRRVFLGPWGEEDPFFKKKKKQKDKE